MLNKDFLKEVFTEEKFLLHLNDVKRINVPLYDELSVVTLWPMMKEDKEFMVFFPSKMAKGRVPDREYFMNILNTCRGDYLQQLIKHAHEERCSGKSMATAKETIEISDKWWDSLNALPFVSRKLLSSFLNTPGSDQILN